MHGKAQKEGPKGPETESAVLVNTKQSWASKKASSHCASHYNQPRIKEGNGTAQLAARRSHNPKAVSSIITSCRPGGGVGKWKI